MPHHRAGIFGRFRARAAGRSLLARLGAFARDWWRRRGLHPDLIRHWRARTEQYRLIVDGSDDWEYLQAADGRLLYVSPSCERITGYRAAEFLADPELLGAIVHPDDRADFLAHCAAQCNPRNGGDHAPTLAAPHGEIDFRILTRQGATRWIGHRCARIRVPGRLGLGHRASNRDISAHKTIEFRLGRATRLLESVRLAQSRYLNAAPSGEVFKQLLDILVDITDSEYGFLDEVLTDADGTPYKLSLALSNISWDAASRRLYEELAARNLEFRNLRNLSGAPVTSRAVVISEDPAHDPRSGGLPPGHPPLLNYLGMPIFLGDELVGVAGIANRKGGYDPELADWLQPFLGTCASLIHAMRMDQRRRQTEESLARADRHNRALLEASLDPLVVIDPDGRISDVNRATEAVTGQPRERLLGTEFSSYFRDPELARIGYRIAFDQGEVRDYALDLVHRDGQVMPVLYNAAVYRDQEGAVEQVFAAARDVTRIRRLTDMLEARLRLLESAESRTLEEILRASVDEAAALTDSLIGFYHFVEQDQQSLTLQTWSTRTLREFCQAEGSGLHYPLSEAGVWVDCVHQRRGVIHNDYAALPQRRGLPAGHAQVIRELVVPVFRDERIVAILGVGNKPTDYGDEDLHIASVFADLAWDIAERKRFQAALRDSEARYRRMAHYDPLTGLPNRVLLADRLRIALALSRREERLLALCYLDLDGFKPVNDTYGHEAGDRLLRAVAARLTQSLREDDTVARLGGDEFVLLLGRLTGLDECRQALERLLAVLAQPYDLGLEQPVGGLSASIGVTLYPLDPSDADTLLRHADLAMYEAKQAGRNQFRWFERRFVD